jgi:hypothetical protein
LYWWWAYTNSYALLARYLFVVGKKRKYCTILLGWWPELGLARLFGSVGEWRGGYTSFLDFSVAFPLQVESQSSTPTATAAAAAAAAAR